MGCEPCMGEQDAKIAGRWIRKVEKNMIQISIPEGLRVHCETQLLSDRAMTWWGTGSPITDTMCVKYKKKLLLFWA